MYTFPYALRIQLLNAWTTLLAPLAFAGLKVGLLNQPQNISTRMDRATVLLDDATFHGYTAGGVAPTGWGGQYRDGFDNVYQDLLPVRDFIATDDVVDETIYASFIDTGTQILVENLPAPIRVKQAGDFVRVFPTLPLGQ